MNTTSASDTLRNVFLSALVGLLVGLFVYFQFVNPTLYHALFGVGIFGFAIDRGGFKWLGTGDGLHGEAIRQPRMGDNEPLVPMHNAQRARHTSARACKDEGITSEELTYLMK